MIQLFHFFARENNDGLRSRTVECRRLSVLSIMSLLLVGCFLALCRLGNAEPRSISFSEAARQATQFSPKLEAARAEVSQQYLHHEALEGLGGPTVMLSASAGRYEVNGNINLQSINQGLTLFGHELGEQLAPLFPNGLPPIDMPTLPDSIDWQRSDDFHSANIVMALPIYTGGRVEAIKSFSHGRYEESLSNQSMTQYELQQQIVERYFMAVLAESVAELRQKARFAIRNHDNAAASMLGEGLISNAERLQASAAYEEAKRASEEADNNLHLARVALARTIQTNGSIRPSSALFVGKSPLEPLSYFQSMARANHPGFETLQAKTHQAEALKSLNDARWHPNVSLFASHEVDFDDPNWMVGVNMNWMLYSPIDRNKMIASSQARLHQVDATKRQVESDIALLVERNWLQVENARNAYFAMGKNRALAQEVKKLRAVGLQEGVNTTIDLIDAETNLAKVRVEQAKAAFDYVIALQALLASAGMPEQFEAYMQRAEIRL